MALPAIGPTKLRCGHFGSETARMIEIEAVSKRFSKHLALDKIELTLGAGQIFGLLGPNGAGKTTLMRIVCTLLRADSGTVRVNGYDVARSPLQVRQQIGVVSAGMGVYERLSGRENLEFFAELHGLAKATCRARIEALRVQLGIGDWLDLPASGYSTGMKQKIVIARAVLHEPLVLLLDEASNGLDVLARRALLEFAMRYRALGKLVIYSTHVMSEAESLCDRAAILHMGRVIACDSAAALRAKTPAGSLEETFFALTRAAELEGALAERFPMAS
jgi:sodium transport system ATP-binding protein